MLKDWLESRCKHLITEVLQEVTGKDLQISFSIRNGSSKQGVSREADSLAGKILVEENQSPQLYAKYTFDTFVVGNSNQFAHAASLAVAQTPANAYNPLFLHGGVGLGKTHLMQAIGNYILSTNPVARVTYAMIEDIRIPDLETRAAILNKKAELEGIHVPREVTSYIAEVVPSNVRELEGALIRVIAHTSLLKVSISLEIVVEILKDFVARSNPVELSVPHIQQVVSDYYGVTLEELISPKRDQRLVRPRQIAMFICRDLTDASLPTLGESFGGRHYTTVLHACEKIASMRNDPSVAQTLKNIVAKLKGNNNP